MSSEKKLLFCDECMTIYYDLPEKGVCPICNTEVSENDILTINDMIICQTCSTLYSPQNSNEIIPKNLKNPNNLCACKHLCPRHSLLGKGKETPYLGNLVKAEMYKCSNCGAIYYRNKETNNKNCQECHSKLVYSMNIDPFKQKVFFRCANPQHGIRLKVRDLIENNNKIIHPQMEIIKKKEKGLNTDYSQKLQQIQQIKGIMRKKKIEEQTKLINEWVHAQHQDLYAKIKDPGSLHCAVFKGTIGNLVNTRTGCGAIADVKVRRVMLTDSKGTIIKRKDEKPKEELEILSTEPKSSEIEDPQIMESGEKKIEPEIETETPETEIKTEKDSEKKDYTEFENLLPKLEKDQIYIKIELLGSKSLTPSSPEGFSSINFGIIPIKISEERGQFRVGAEELSRAYWIETKMFETQPHIFNNIGNKQKGEHLVAIQKSPEGIQLIPNHLAVNVINIIAKGETKEVQTLKNPVLVKTIEEMQINGYYDLTKEKTPWYQALRFNISVKLA